MLIYLLPLSDNSIAVSSSSSSSSSSNNNNNNNNNNVWELAHYKEKPQKL